MNESLTFDERMTLLVALDTLSCALEGHGHHWTEDEREVFEQALSVVGILNSPEDDMPHG